MRGHGEHLSVTLLFLGVISFTLGAAIRDPSATVPLQMTEEEKKRMSSETPYPRIAMLWASVRGDSSVASHARHDLILTGTWWLGLEPDRKPVGLADGFTEESVEAARRRVGELRSINPDVIVLCEICFYEYHDEWLPAAHPWWLRIDGRREQFWPGTHRMDWYNLEYRSHIVAKTKALKESGVDGVFYDNLRDEREPWIAFLKAVREAVGDDFLILVNAGYQCSGLDWVAPYLNGIMYESGWSHRRTEWDECVRSMRRVEELLRPPHISVIERFEEIRDRAGWPGDPQRGKAPKRDPAARRWTMCYALIIGDYYYAFSDNTSHHHDWYPEYDVKIGSPVAPGERISSHVWQRRYEKALVVVNLPGAAGPHTIKLRRPARDTLTGQTGTGFLVPPGEGLILTTGD